MVVSEKYVALIDPHRKCISEECRSAGTRRKLKDFLEYKSHASTFEFWLKSEKKSYDGTIFRFPLRQEGSCSKISNKVCTPQMIRDDLFESLKNESTYILLFLQNVKSISLWQWTEKSHKDPQKVFKVLTTDDKSDSFTETCGSKVTLRLNCVSARIHNTPSESTSPVDHHWLVMQVMGTNNYELRQLGEELSVLPWVGLATKLKEYVSLRNCKADTSDPLDDCSTIRDLFTKLEGELQKARMPIEMWSTNDSKSTDGHAFCFLPLPEQTAMPVHIHGYFAVTDNRRSIKWPAEDEKGKEAEWNKRLLLEIVAPSYALLLACRAKLSHYKNTPLPVTNTDNINDAYSNWPLHPELKNVPIWQELVSPTVSFFPSLPLLWSSACGGKWVTIEQAMFLPGSCGKSTLDCSEAVIRLLIKMDVPVVSLPKSVCDTINHTEKVKALVKPNEISPKFLRHKIGENPNPCSSLPKKYVYEVLEFVLKDLASDTYTSLDGLPLLPLKDSRVIEFETSKSGDSSDSLIVDPEGQGSGYKYIVPKELLDIIHGPGADSLIVDPELPDNISITFCEIAKTGSLQLKEVNNEVVCKQLLPKSISAWCKVKSESNVGWKWLPGKDSMPSLSWMTDLWQWIADSQVKLSWLDGLPILPQLPVGDYQEGVILIKISKSVKICCISSQFHLKEREILLSIMTKLGFLIVDEKKVNNWNNMEDHPDVREFVPELSPNCELIIQNLENLSTKSRFQAIQDAELSNRERDFLREQFSNLHDSCVNYQSCLRSIPIYCAYSDVVSTRFIPIDPPDNNNKAFLPPKDISNISSLPIYPSMMLKSTLSSDLKFFETLGVQELSLSDFFIKHLIPLACEHIKQNLWSEGDDLVLWIFKQQISSLENVLKTLSKYEIIFTRNHTHRKPEDIYDPTDQRLAVLFDIEKDREYFPDDQYSKTPYKQALKDIGIQTWETFQINSDKMSTLLNDRMNSIKMLDPSAQLRRGQCIIETLVEYNSKVEKLDKIDSEIPFLQAETCPSSYPACLDRKWCGKDELYSITKLCSPDKRNHDLVGTVLPILSESYKYSVSMDEFEMLPFYKITEQDVLKHLENLQSNAISGEDVTKLQHIIMSVYDYLLQNLSEKTLNCIWWSDAEIARFMPAEKCVTSLPLGFSHYDDLKPHYYGLQMDMHKYANIFRLHSPLTTTDVDGILEEIQKQNSSKLSNEQVKLCVSILNWLYDQSYEKDDMLMLTEMRILAPATECVFDDREWMEDSKHKNVIERKSFIFVHEDILPKVAKFFKVRPLSSKVVPSQKLGFEIVGQHEPITQRIKKIVKDYGTNIDIFKELIQNADDAGATEVKFLIDWRCHPKSSLISEQLKEWQGPALIAYNNAMFSKEDLDNILRVGGETKKDNALKTGRFGVGFCATYHLTDLPSFISGKFFVMFDPHTSYIGDRIDARSPGMRLDLVKHQADLKFFHDQFVPYDDLLGCNVFNLSSDGYKGTLFRFPFRSNITKAHSDICEAVYERQDVDNLIQALKRQANKVLLFLKHVRKISVLRIEKTSEPSSPEHIFSVQCSVNSSERMKLLLENVTDSKHSSFTKTVEVQVGSKIYPSTWLMSSVVEPLSAKWQNKSTARGLLNFAEVALKVDPSGDKFKTVPMTENYGSLFCFLPLPENAVSKLPFHINGFFIVGSNRRLSIGDASLDLWNKSLAEGPLVTAFINLLQYLCSSNESDLKCVSSDHVSSGDSVSNSDSIQNGQSKKQEFLSHYYSLWNLISSETSDPIRSSFATAFKRQASKLTCPLLWSELNGGCWLPPVNVCVFHDSRLQEKDKEEGSIKKIIAKDAISLLLKHGKAIVENIPDHIHNLFDKLEERKYDYVTFCTEVFFPSIDSIDVIVRNRNIKFLLEQLGAHYGEDDWYKHVKDFLSKEVRCISCQGSDALRPVCELIDPSKEYLKNLFNISEGKFPSEELQNSSAAMRGLERLGMTNKELTMDDLKKRAKSVTTLLSDHKEYEVALKRFEHIHQYIDSVYSAKPVEKSDELKQLLDIPFLPVKPKPTDHDIPWYGDAGCFYSPSKVYSFEHSDLVFTQHPVVNNEKVTSKLCSYLKVNSEKPPVMDVILNLKCLINHKKDMHNEKTIPFLNDCMRAMYRYLEDHLSTDEKETIVESLMELKFIWQDDSFLSSKQVFFNLGNRKCLPYMSELSSTNKHYSELMKAVGVEEEISITVMVDTLKEIATDHNTTEGPKPISRNILDFVVYISGQLNLKLTNKQHSHEIYLPDENCFMCLASDMAEKTGSELIENLPEALHHEYEASGYYVHKEIPHDCAKNLGVHTLLDALLKTIEDEDFLNGTDFGQHEDLRVRLNGILKKYPADISIFKEFIQNADDAQATEIMFVLDCRTDHPDDTLLNSSSNWKSLQKIPALCIYNNRKFTKKDIEGITKLGRGGKDSSTDKIGTFGIGFNVAYHITDCPSFASYSETGSLEYLCVFDPTKSFVTHAYGHSKPGRKWVFNDKLCSSKFPDQFKPYLSDDLSLLLKHASCHKEHNGYVVFRLPLSRYNSLIHYQKDSPPLEGHMFSPDKISELFEDLKSISQDVLLFLKHLRSISAFEITSNKAWKQHFTTTAMIPSGQLGENEYKKFIQSVKTYRDLATQASITSTQPLKEQCVSVGYKMEITCTQPDSIPNKQTSEWLLQWVIGGNDRYLSENYDLLQAGLSQGLLPVGSVATKLKPSSKNHPYHVFCFLPLPMSSNLPVHVNSHFLIDDSRKHLETIMTRGLSCWNERIAKNVIVHAYIDLIQTLKGLLDQDSEITPDFYYSLFPKSIPSTANQGQNTNKNVGQLESLELVPSFYAEILEQTLPLLIREQRMKSTNGVDSTNSKEDNQSMKCEWMNVEESLFCVPFKCPQEGSDQKTTELIVSKDLRETLVYLGLPITSAPDYIYDECLKVDSEVGTKAAITPGKVVKHLRGTKKEDEQTIKKGLMPLLRYCVSGSDLDSIPDLFSEKGGLYLLAMDGSLQRSPLFKSEFSDLIPDCKEKFVDHSLEDSDVGDKLQHKKCNVICELSLKVVADHIDLPKDRSITEHSKLRMQRLWEYLNKLSQESSKLNVPSMIRQHFYSKAIIPASDGMLYPLSQCNTLIRSSEASNDCPCCSVMKKLGYPHVDFSKIDFPPSNLLKDLTSCFQKGEDIVQCFSQTPPNSDKLDSIELTEAEVVSFRTALGKYDLRQEGGKVSRYLLQMPLFCTIYEEKIRLHEVKEVFLLNQITSLPEGIPSIDNGKVVLKAVNSQTCPAMKFYTAVIPGKHCQLKHVNPEELYMKFVFPLLPKFQVKDIKAHVDYILSREEEQMKTALNKLKYVKFIKHNDKYYCPRDLYNPEVEFYETFYPDYILPDNWKDKTETLKRLGLHSTVTTHEWLECAEAFARKVREVEEAQYPEKNIEKKSKVLLDEVKEIIMKLSRNEKKEKSHSDGKELPLKEFLNKVATIKFLYSKQQFELNTISILPEEVRRSHVCIIKFEGSVSSKKNADLACLCKPVLPESCLTLMEYKEDLSVEDLSVETPASSITVAENLKELCKLVSPVIDEIFNNKVVYNDDKTFKVLCDDVRKLNKLFEAHYSFLSDNMPSANELKNINCILRLLINDKRRFISCQLLYPSQIVIKLSKYGLMPYCCRATPSLQKHEQFLTDLGARYELKAHDWIDILLRIKENVESNTGTYGHCERTQIETVYRELIKSLRQCKTTDNIAMNIVLPDESLTLCNLADLCFDDASWYKERLPENSGLSIIYQPPPDDRGNLTLPECLPVKRLSDIITEKLLESYKSSDFTCIKEELYKMHKRQECDRCSFVRKILEILRSGEVCSGLYRVYYSDHLRSPPDEFKMLVKELKKINVLCFNSELKTVLLKDGEIIQNSERSSSCYLNDYVLYIAPHSVPNTEFHLFYSSLAICINSVLNFQIRNMGAIAAIFQCSPNQIHYTLTKVRVRNYIDCEVDLVSSLPWGEFSPLDALIVLNFFHKERVHYISDDGSLLDAEIEECGQGKMNSEIYIKVIAENYDSEDVVSRESDKIRVSPLQLFKDLVLDSKQKKVLSPRSESIGSSHVVLAQIPYEDPPALENWFKEMKLLIPSSCSTLVQSILTLRLIAHLHYCLQTRTKKSQTELVSVFQKIQGLICESAHTAARVKCMVELTHKTIEKCTSSAVSAPVYAIFPNKAIGKIIQMKEQSNSDQNSTESTNPSPFQSGRSYSTPMDSYPPPVAATKAISDSPSASDLSQIRHAYKKSQHSENAQPDICMQSATAWFEQAKADYNSAICLLGSDTVSPSVATKVSECKFPALVCFVCHDTVEKCIKGIYYAFCGLKQDLINCSNLVILCDTLKSLPHHPTHLMEPITECIMSVTKHENRSRFPYYKNPPCAPASIYHIEDAKEAFQATSKLLRCLQSEERLREILNDLNEPPARRYMSILQTMSDSQEYPHNWEHMEDTDQVKLFLLDPISEREEYERVSNEFLLTLPTLKILKIERIQNKVQWRRYLNCSRNFHRSFLREELLFHGTRDTQPKDIYRGGEGFDMRFCPSGMWGRGNYFAVNSSYANGYSFKINGVKKIFAAWVLTGNSVYLPPDSNLTKPPLMNEPRHSSTSVQLRYDSVCGLTGGSRVYITYDNEHAYPAYLITYRDQ